MVREPQAVRLAAFCYSFPVVIFAAVRKDCRMVGTDTYRRNDDGTYSSEYGYSVSKAPNGDLYVGGAPTGYRDIGFGVQQTHTEWFPSFQPSSAPASYKPYAPPVQSAYSGGYAGAGYSVSQTSAPSAGSFLGFAIYPWMLLLALAAYAYVSATVTFFPPGLHLHPAYGVAAFFGSIWLYRQMMVFLPTACILAIPSALISGLIAWAFSDGSTLREWAQTGANLSRPLATAESLWPVMNGWIAAAIALNLAAHFSYWRYRRVKVRGTGWLLSRSPMDTAKEILTIAVASGAIGWIIARIWHLA
jgi:hypothetical protein